MTVRHGAHASMITLGGETFAVRRSFALICRIEERFGPLREFGERLEGCRFTMRELADLYRLLLADVERKPGDEAIEAHLLGVGIIRAVTELHPLVTAFFFGEERFMKRVAGQANGSRPRDAAPASSPGATSSAPHPG